jgi:LysR family transcriptional regulator, transcriptional activator for bauABCD operon
VNLADVDLRLLRVFMTIVRCGGFTQAQAVLNLSQSTVSNHVKSLEERLGVHLCDRGRTGFRLTQEGRKVFEATERLLHSIETFRAEVLALKGELAGEIRIGIVDNTINDQNSPLVRTLASFMTMGPAIRPHLTISDPPSLEMEVTRDGLDAAIGVFPGPIASLARLPFYHEAQRFYCGAGHRFFAEPDSVSIEEIRSASVITRSYWQLADLDRLGMQDYGAMANSMEAALALVLTGYFVGFLPVHLAAPFVERGSLRHLLPEQLGYDAKIEVISRKSQEKQPLLQAFLKCCSEHGHKEQGSTLRSAG